MNSMNVDSVLSQIRAMSSQMKSISATQSASITSGSVVADKSAEQPSFASLMTKGLNQVNQNQQTASDLATKFERGAPGVELSDVMIEMQKASVSFRAATEVRNRMVSAYQDIMNMQI